MNRLQLLLIADVILVAGKCTAEDACNECLAESPIVSIHDVGRVKGLRRQLPLGQVDAFLGIPYAKPPVGDLRFRPPVPLHEAWTEDLDASRLPAQCYQVNDADMVEDKTLSELWTPLTANSEDCLYLNVWKPTTTNVYKTSPKAVLVWIYGGGFSSGTTSLDLYDGSILSLKGDVVVVSMQYRVGPLGFLAVDDSSAPGNVGLLDQQLALRWVHDHIAAFGGDPQRVTLFGESAGAISTSLHLLNEDSEPLFRSAVLQSGAATLPCCLTSKDVAGKRAKELAVLVGCPTERVSEMLTCLRQTDANLLTTTQWLVPVEGSRIKGAFVPSVDGKFITERPLEALRSNRFQKKPVLAGLNNNEGSFFLFFLFPAEFDVKRPYNASLDAGDFRRLLKDLRVLDNRDEFLLDVLAFEYSTPCGADERAKTTYFDALDKILGDFEFNCPTMEFVQFYANAKQSPVYLYTYNHSSPANPLPAWAGTTPHAYELDMMFGRPWNPDFVSKYTDRERILSSRIIESWTNFAKTSDPNIDDFGRKTEWNWPEFGQPERRVLVLDAGEQKRTQIGYRDRQCALWKDVIMPQYMRQQP